MLEEQSSVEELADLIRRLYVQAQDDDWHERERAGFTLRNLIEERFSPAMELSKDWAGDKSPRVRRAACLGCMHRKAFGTKQRILKILERLDVTMQDQDTYVRKCCGPYVVGYLG